MKKLWCCVFFVYGSQAIAGGGSSGQATFNPYVTIYDDPATTVQFGDIDGDGLDEDLFVAEGGRHSGGANSRVFAWFEAPDWIKHDIAPTLGPFTGDSDLVDIDGDDDLDIVIAADSHNSGSDSDAVYWYENTGDFSNDWPQHIIEFDVPDAFHIGDLETGDVDGDGKIDVVVRHLSTLRFVVYFQNTSDDWQPLRINTRHREGLAVADLDNNGRDDIIGNGYILFAPLDARNDSWNEVTFDAEYYDESQSGLNNSVKTAVADMNDDGRNDIIMSSAEGNAVHLAWYKNPINAQTDVWQRHIIEQPQGKNHQVQIVDIDLDGDPDVYGGFSFGGNGVFWWENVNSTATSWQRHTIDTGRGCYSCIATDFDHDGDFDFAGPQKYTGRVNLYENTTAVNTLMVNVDQLSFSSSASSLTIEITADVDWQIQPSEAWLTVNPSNGSGDAVLQVNVEAFSGVGQRQASISLSGGGITRLVSVIQDGVPDVQSPSVPQNLMAIQILHDRVQLSWQPSTDNSGVVASYDIYQDAVKINDGLIVDSMHVVTGLMAESSYEFQVSARDNSDNESDLSAPIMIDTAEAPSGPQAWAYWSLDDGSGLVAQDIVGQNDGTLENMSGTEWLSSNLSGAILFDGVDDLIDVGNFNLPTQAFTITAWINPDDLVNHPEGRIISKASGLSSNAHEWMISTIESSGQSRLRFRLKINGSTTTLVANSSVVVEGVWTHVGVSYDNDGVMRIYQNAIEIGSITQIGNIANSSAPVAIGNQPSADRPFSGIIDDVCIFAEALSVEALELIYNNGDARPCMQVVSNQQPLANAGQDAVVVDLDNSGDEVVLLDASLSEDVDGSIVNYLWSEGLIEWYQGPDPSVEVNLAVGVHTLTLTVTDDQSALGVDDVTIVVEPQPDMVAPVIVQPGPLQIKQGVNNGFVVTTLSAKDKNTLVDWAIVSGNISVDGDQNPAFGLSSNTGVLSVNDSDDIDVDVVDEFNLLVTVSDGVNTSEVVNIIINVISDDVIFSSGFE